MQVRVGVQLLRDQVVQVTRSGGEYKRQSVDHGVERRIQAGRAVRALPDNDRKVEDQVVIVIEPKQERWWRRRGYIGILSSSAALLASQVADLDILDGRVVGHISPR